MRFPPFRLGSHFGGGGQAEGGRPRLAIVTCIKNEGEDLVEWLCFHRQIGVSRFVIYDNLSTDSTLRVLNAVPFRDEITLHIVSDEQAQKFAFRDAIRRYQQELDWVAFIDGDEFIVPLAEMSLVDKLSEIEARGVDGIGLHWRSFGSSGHKVRPAGLVTESFVHRAEDRWSANRHVKSIVRIGAVEGMGTQHYFQVRGAYLLDDGTAPPEDFKGLAGPASFNQGFAIHHYVTKSRAQCLAKIARGRPMSGNAKNKYRNLSYWISHDRNEVEDRRAAEVIAPIRESVLKLRGEIDAAVDHTPDAKLAVRSG